MEKSDIDIKKLFEESSEALSPDTKFMERIERAMEAVDTVESLNRSLVKKSRTIAVFSALAGFICGIIMSVISPWIKNLVDSIVMTVVKNRVAIAEIDIFITYAAIAIISVGAAMVTYQVLSSLQSVLKRTESSNGNKIGS